MIIFLFSLKHSFVSRKILTCLGRKRRGSHRPAPGRTCCWTRGGCRWRRWTENPCPKCHQRPQRQRLAKALRSLPQTAGQPQQVLRTAEQDKRLRKSETCIEPEDFELLRISKRWDMLGNGIKLRNRTKGYEKVEHVSSPEDFELWLNPPKKVD